MSFNRIGDDFYINGTVSAAAFYGDGSNLTGISGGSGTEGTSGTSGTTFGTSGTRGTSGTSGTSGTRGTSGTQGRSAGIQYNFITNTALSDPGATNFKFRGSGTLSSTNNILISVIDVNNIDQTIWLSTLTNGYLILRSNNNTGTNFAVLTITSTTLVTNSPYNYYSLVVDITYTTGNWNLSSPDLVVLNFSKSGGTGTSGTRGTSGTSGTGTSGTRGTSGTGFSSILTPGNNRVLTSDGATNSAVAETNLTFDGSILTVTGDVVVSGDLTISGTTSTINTQNLLVKDPLILLASTHSGTPVLDSGIMISRGTGATQAFIWDESSDEFAVISTNNSSSTYGNLTISGYSNLRVGGLTVSQIKIVDGTQGSGKYLVSDANGVASWTASSSSLYEVHTGLNSTRRIGVGNTASADYSATLAGSGNSSTGQYSVIVGGQNNYLSGWHSFIGGGQNNSNYSVDYLAIVGGQNNKAQAEYSFIGTGFNNTISFGSYNSSIVAGQYNTASATNVHIIGSNIIGTYSDTTYVNKLNIGSFSSQSTVDILGVDSNGNVTVTSGTSESGNIFIHGGYSNTTGTDNVYIGNYSGWLGLTSSSNVFIGDSAGYYNKKSNNVFIGANAGYKNDCGLNNTYIGYNSGALAGTFSCFNYDFMVEVILQTCNNTFIGYNSGYSGCGLENSTFIGYNSGYLSRSGIAPGGFMNPFPIGANCNTFIGSESGYSNLYGTSNTFIGYRSGFSNTSVDIFDWPPIVSSGDNNTFIGSLSGHNNMIGSNNTFIGFNAGYSSTQSGSNTFIGYNAGSLNTANYNTFVGSVSGQANTTGTYNSFFGDGAGLSNTTGSCNTFIGMLSGCCTTTGGHNTFIGNRSAAANINGTGNVALGSDAMLTGNYSCVISIGACSSPSANGQFLIGSTTYPVLTGTTASAGSNGDVPSQVSRYMCIILNGIQYKMPLYN